MRARLSIQAIVAVALFAVLLGTGSMAAASAGHSSSAIPVRCPHLQKPRGSVTVGDLQFPISLNPYCCGPEYGVPAFYSTYFVIDNHGRTVPDLATEVPAVANGGIRDGGRTIVIHLIHGAVWSNGAEITSADARFGWQTEMNMNQTLDLGQVETVPCLPRCLIAAVDTPDRYTAVFHLKHPDPAFIPSGLPMLWPPRWRNLWNNNPRAAARWLGNTSYDASFPTYPTDGPYRVARFDSDGLTLMPMKRYDVLSCGARLARIRFVPESDLPSAVVAAATHRIDLAWNSARLFDDVAVPDFERYGYAYRIHLYPSGSVAHVELNTDPHFQGAPNPVHDVRVRQALALALDKQGLVSEMFGLSGAAARDAIQWSFLPRAPGLNDPYADRSITGQWDPVQRKYVAGTGQGQALADARRLLAETPWRHGFALEVATQCPCPVQAAEKRTVQASWARLGVHVTFAQPQTLFDTWENGGILAHGSFQAALLSYAPQPDVDLNRYYFGSGYIEREAPSHPAGDQNYAAIHDATIDRALARTLRTGNTAVWHAAWNTVQEQVNKQAYWIPLFQPPSFAVDDGRIAPISYSAYGRGQFWNMWAWHVG